MFAFVARLRPRAVASAAAAAFLFLTNMQSVAAKDEVLFTSSVSYCEPPELILVQQFDVTFFPANQSIFFNISAASVQDNVNVSASIAVTVYGMSLLNTTIDLCTLLNGALCPLPTYNFIGSEVIPLPSSLDVASKIPGIAYKIPDLEAFAQLTLTSVDDNTVKACVQSTLSNGWSTRQTAVEWVTGVMALAALASALLSTLYLYPSRAPERLLDLMHLFQAIASSALLDLNYPVVYRAFASNFSWALGLFSSTDGSPIQTAINNMRHHTGGFLTDISGNGVDLVNRKLSPYSVSTPSSAGDTETLVAVEKLQKQIAANTAKMASSAGNAVKSLAKRDSTVTINSSNQLNAGIPVFTGSLGISTANAFMTVFFTVLFLTVITLFVFGSSYAIFLLVSRGRERKGMVPGRVEEWKQNFPSFAKSWSLRLTLIAFLPVGIFALHQWTLKDSWLSVLLSVITLIAILAYIVYPTFLTLRLVKRNGGQSDAIYEGIQQHLASYGPLYSRYRPARYYFFVAGLVMLFLRAVVIGFGSSDGFAQVIVLIIFEVAFLIATLVLRPHDSRGSEVLTNTLTIVRTLLTGLSFAFVQKFDIAAIPRVVIGLIGAVIASLAVILMFFNIISNLGLKTFWREHVMRRWGTKLGSRTRLDSTLDPSPDSGSATPTRDMEKGEKEKNVNVTADVTESSSSGLSRLRGGEGSEEQIDRPQNPTPTSNVPLDSEVNVPYPEYTPTTPSSHHNSPPLSSQSNAYAFRNSDYRVSYSSSQMPVTATTLDSFSASVSNSGHSASTFGRELPRRSEFEGLGFDNPVEEKGRDGDERSSRRGSSVYGSAPTTPATSTSTHSYGKGQRESWLAGGKTALPRMDESDEGSHIHS